MLFIQNLRPNNVGNHPAEIKKLCIILKLCFSQTRTKRAVVLVDAAKAIGVASNFSFLPKLKTTVLLMCPVLDEPPFLLFLTNSLK